MKSFKNDYLKDNAIRAYADNLVSAEASARIDSFSNLQTSLNSKINTSSKAIPNGIATLDTDGLLTGSQRPPVVASGNVYIFRPGETSPIGNVYNDWATMIVATQSKQGLKYIQFDDSLQGIAVPVDNVNFSEFILLPRYKKANYIDVTFTSGFLLSTWPIEIRGLNLKFSSHFNDNSGTNAFTMIDASIQYSGTSSNGVDFITGSLTIFMRNSQIVGPGNSLFSLANRTLQIFAVSGFCNVDPNLIKSNSLGNLNVTNYGASSPSIGNVVQSQPSFLGTRSDIDFEHTLERTILSKGQLITKNDSGSFVAFPVGADNELLAFDSSTATGLKSIPQPGALNTPGMKTITDYVRQSSPVTSLLPAGNKTIDCATANLFRITGGTATITISNLTENEVVNVVFESTGSAYTITWTGGTFLWPGATVPTPSSTASRKDIYTFIKINGVIFGSAVLSMG
ncbi:hypothetical protein CH380_19835 [Leptospira adleri]|uniref:Uncharacterized protein n=2 Tax=Leptospira adleri TaxID=2023186 RepID=A0A2M9YJ24_9LEPT|nr:hypothetical protein CH380_19835 [Leptospira adleri]PJZ60260.1 hypothetical protein CH376_19355 [Leptospira adleri]